MSDPLTTGVLVVLLVASFYFIILRPQRKRQAEQQKTQRALEPGVRVLLASGMYADVVRVGEKQAVVEVAPGVPVTVLKQVIVEVITPESQYAEDEPVSDRPEEGLPASETDSPAVTEREGAHPQDKVELDDEPDTQHTDPDKA